MMHELSVKKHARFATVTSEIDLETSIYYCLSFDIVVMNENIYLFFVHKSYFNVKLLSTASVTCAFLT